MARFCRGVGREGADRLQGRGIINGGCLCPDAGAMESPLSRRGRKGRFCLAPPEGSPRACDCMDLPCRLQAASGFWRHVSVDDGRFRSGLPY